MSCLNGAAVRAMTAAATPSPEGVLSQGAEPKCSKLGVGKERVRDLPGTVDAGHGPPQKSPQKGSHGRRSPKFLPTRQQLPSAA